MFLVPVPNLLKSQFEWTDSVVERYRALTLEKLKVLGVEDLSQRIVAERLISPKDWETKYGVYAGATFNLSHNLTQMLHMRPHNRFEELDGVYLVGGGTHPEADFQ